MIFESERLVARRFDPRDLGPFVAMRTDPEVARYQNWESYSEADGLARLEDLARRNPGEEVWFQFALEDKSDGSFAGDCGLRIMPDPRLAQIGYTICRPRWNRGYGTEAVRSLAAYAFGSFDIHRITASVDPRNLSSCRVLEKAGFRKEAHFVESEWFKGAWADDAIYALLRHELSHAS